LAKKTNEFPEEIDLTVFDWVTAGSNPQKEKPGCGGCHPGGGGMERDRDGLRYDRRLAEQPELAQSLDGDYRRSQWTRTGVIEADCFICHLPGYYFNERIRQLDRLNFKWAIVAATGIGRVTGSVKADETPEIIYNRRYFDDDGRIVVDLMSPPSSENCVSCHGIADLIKRGFSWNERLNHDVHNLHGLECVQCHPGNPEHNFAKGDENMSTVRDDLDDTMLTCRQCHMQGFMGAPRPHHTGIRPNHLDKLGCEVCHIPAVFRTAAQGLCVSTGKVRNYPRAGAKRIGDRVRWQPDYRRDHSGVLKPVNYFQANLYTNQNKDGLYHPLFAREIQAAFKVMGKPGAESLSDQPVIRAPDDIRRMLAALAETLKGNRRFDNVRPRYHFQGKIYYLDDHGKLQATADDSWVTDEEGFNISHNVAPTRMALGANGCGDCHQRSSHVFESWIAQEIQSLGSEAAFSLSGLSWRGRPLADYLEELHAHNSLKYYLVPGLFVLVFFLVVHRHACGRIQSWVVPGIWPIHLGVVKSLLIAVRWTCLFFLAFSGLVFFYNNMSLLFIFFSDMEKASLFHVAAGIVFMVAVGGVGVIDWLDPVQKTAARGVGILLPPAVPETRHAAEPPRGIRWRGHTISLETLMIGLLAATGGIMVFRGHLGLEIKYLVSACHALTAILFMAGTLAKAYHALTRRGGH